jgi:hypothetical protein
VVEKGDLAIVVAQLSVFFLRNELAKLKERIGYIYTFQNNGIGQFLGG